MKACRDCIHVHTIIEEGVDGHSALAKCHHPKAFVEVGDYYQGKQKIIAMSVEMMRVLGACGIDGTLFTSKVQ